MCGMPFAFCESNGLGVVFCMGRPKQLDIMACYQLAWKSFAKWWIPLCLISAGILVFKLGPKLATGGSMGMLNDGVACCVAIMRGDQRTAEDLSYKLRQDTKTFVRKFIRYSGMAMPFVFVLWSVLLLFANRAVKDSKKKQSILRILSVAVWRLMLAILKLLPLLLAVVIAGIAAGLVALHGDPILWVRWYHFAAVLLIVLLVVALSAVWFCYTYVRLLFVPLIMFDGETGGFAACRGSWRQTQGYFGVLLLICFLNGFVQATLAVTIIGAIPGLSFVETVRAAAFRMTLPEGEGAATGDEEIAQEGDPSAEGDAS